MDFSNFKQISIDGEEVVRLAIDGDVVWEKAPVPFSILLTTDKSTIMTGETATLSALVLDKDNNPCPNVEVSFSCDIPNSTIYHSITNDVGIATMEYVSTSVGDIQFTASINSLTDNVDVEDCDWWDTAKIDRLSEYNQLIQSSTSLTHSDEAYTYSHSSTRNILEIPVSNLNEPFMFEVDILFSSGNGFEDGLTIFDLFNPETTVWNNTLELAQYPNTKGFGGYRNNTWTIHNRTNSNPNFNVWLKFRATIYENTVKGEVINLNNNSVLFNATINYSALNLKCGILMKNGSCNGKFKNIKIKKLA